MGCRVAWLTCPCIATSLLVESPSGQALLVACAAFSGLGPRAQAGRAKSAYSGPGSSCGKVATPVLTGGTGWVQIGGNEY